MRTIQKRTLEALVKSVAKWDRNTRVEHPSDVKSGAGECPLCELFIKDHCDGCPVAKVAKIGGCMNTPYMECEDALFYWEEAVENDEPQPEIEKAKDSAIQSFVAEFQFLESLIPDVAKDRDFDWRATYADMIAKENEMLKSALFKIISQIDQGGDSGKVYSRDYCIQNARDTLHKIS